eukprot:1377183-Rhodomonas_salina.1
MRKLFFWAYHTDLTDCLTSAVVAMSCEMALPWYPGRDTVFYYPIAHVIRYSRCGPIRGSP